MTQDEIIEMARQAGIPFNKWGMIGCEDCEQDIDQNLVAFAKLVAAKEQKKWKDQTAVEIHEAVLEEREACAKVCEGPEWGNRETYAAQECAKAIRARGEA